MLRTVASEVPWPPGVHEFFPPPIAGPEHWFTKFTLFLWISVAVILIFFLVAYRSPKLVPTRTQWMAESVYGFVRDGIAKDMIGARGVAFAPYLSTLFVFVLVMNMWAIVPGVQISPNSHIAFPAMLAVITYVIFNYVGIREHGFLKYMKAQLVPPGVPWWLVPLVALIELLSTFILRPLTLALRLFANMFAGHVILLVFSLGGFMLFNSEAIFLKPVSLLSWALAIGLTLFELLVAALQAYVFVLLTSFYVQTSLADEH
jgi:F-type H+-transporting ATPase subunit a